MPCNSDHMKATAFEVRGSKLACFLGELDGIAWTPDEMRGYHPAAYNKMMSHHSCDKMARELCERLKGQDVTRYSLELQIWWRDHQNADAAREASEADERDRMAALQKLTKRERDLLRIDTSWARRTAENTRPEDDE